MGLTMAGATALSSGIGFLGNMLGSGLSGGYNAKEAQKDRDFQERMYNQQVQDNINFWKMQQDYNLPSAQLERLRDAGLSGLLMYGENGMTGNIAGQAPQAASAPHGSKASANFNTQIDLANLALLKEQANVMRSEAAKNQQEVEESRQRAANYEFDVMFKRLNKDLDIAIKQGNLEQIHWYSQSLAQNVLQTGEMTYQTARSMAQAREYEIKRFDFDVATMGERLEQYWYEVKSGRIAANAQMRSSFAAMLNAKANWNLSNAQIGQIALNMSQSRQMFPLLYENQLNTNWSQVQDRIFKGVQISNAQKEGFMKDMQNYFMEHGVSPDSWWLKLAGPFILPTINLNDQWFGRSQRMPVNTLPK